MRRDVRIILVGDGTWQNDSDRRWGYGSLHRCFVSPEGVGKSTIVTSLIKESFIPNVRLLRTHLVMQRQAESLG